MHAEDVPHLAEVCVVVGDNFFGDPGDDGETVGVEEEVVEFGEANGEGHFPDFVGGLLLLVEALGVLDVAVLVEEGLVEVGVVFGELVEVEGLAVGEEEGMRAVLLGVVGVHEGGVGAERGGLCAHHGLRVAVLVEDDLELVDAVEEEDAEVGGDDDAGEAGWGDSRKGSYSGRW